METFLVAVEPKDKNNICVLQDGRPESLKAQEKAKVHGLQACSEFGKGG